jgi:hypothetical protein
MLPIKVKRGIRMILGSKWIYTDFFSHVSVIRIGTKYVSVILIRIIFHTDYGLIFIMDFISNIMI